MFDGNLRNDENLGLMVLCVVDENYQYETDVTK